MRLPSHAVLLVFVACLLAPAAAAAPLSPSAYRDHLNALCIDFQPRLAAVDARAAQAHEANDWGAWYEAMTAGIKVALDENRTLEKISVPVAMRGSMAPVLRIIRRSDGIMRTAQADLGRYDMNGFTAEIVRVEPLAKPLNVAFSNAGLGDCGQP